MIVADSSYLIEGILRDVSLLESQTIVAPDLALYEVANTLWKHETLIRDLKNSSLLIDLFQTLASAGTIQFVRPDKRLIGDTYALAIKHRTPTYDTVFVALALQLGLELKTFDERQMKILSNERGQ